MDVKKILVSLIDQYHRFLYYKRDARYINAHGLKKLTKKELQIINKNWAGRRVRNLDLIYVRMYKKLHGTLPHFFITDYQYIEVLRKTNYERKTFALENKAMLDIYYLDIPTPRVYLRCISSVFYDEQMNVLTLQQSIKRMQECCEVLIIKPTIETSCGKGVKKIYCSEMTEQSIIQLFSFYKGDFVIQECIEQCPEIQEFNPTSINSCRITSIYIGGKFSFSSIIKIGKSGAYLDNWNSSYLVGLNDEGVMSEYGLDIDLNKVYKSDNGIPFKGFKVPCFSKLKNFVEFAHKKYFPQVGIVGWDILIDKNYNVKVIEMNLAFPGILGEQLAAGTFFDEFQNAINELVKK